jgi:hypothetical protein
MKKKVFLVCVLGVVLMVAFSMAVWATDNCPGSRRGGTNCRVTRNIKQNSGWTISCMSAGCETTFHVDDDFSEDVNVRCDC